MNNDNHVTPRQAWIAFLLTTGEFIVAGILLIHDGHILALYLAITYAVRETPGGKEYHVIVAKLYRGACEKVHRIIKK